MANRCPASVAYNIDYMADVLGAFEEAVLLVLVRLRDEAYGRAIHRGVEVRLARNVTAGAVHATLERLERKGLVKSDLGCGTTIRAGQAATVLSIEARRAEGAQPKPRDV